MRKTNIEMLRILAMLMVITYHVQSYVSSADPTLYRILFRTIGIEGGAIGVGIFFIITAWFLQEDYTERKAIKQATSVVLTTVEYLVLFFLVRVIIDVSNGSCSLQDLKEILVEGFMMPIWLDRYWFVTTYAFLVLLAPVYIKALNSLSDAKIKYMMILFTVMLVISPFGGTNTGGEYIKNFFYASYIFFLIGYLKRINFTITKGKALVVAVLCWGVLNFGNMLHGNVPEWLNDILHATIGYTGRYQFLQIVIAVCLFYTFLQIEMGHVKWINSTAKLTFGVYLFHNNDIVDVARYAYNQITVTTNIKLVFAVGLVLALFVIGCAVEFLRKLLFEKMNVKIATWLSMRIYQGKEAIE